MTMLTFAKDFYSIKGDTLLQVLDTLKDYMFSEGGEYTHNSVVDTCKLLETEMERQEEG